MAPKKKKEMQWYRADLHIHTPASADYQEPDVTVVDLLHRAEMRGLDIIAFTDHNSVAGYARMQKDIEQLRYLEKLGRATEEEQRLLAEYQRLLEKILVLPGFEFTATFGFHILGIFAPQTPVRQIEHLLLTLHVPGDALDRGNSEVGASSDVLTAYRVINEAGGICIAAHVNSSHGVAMVGFDFGGQTRIAYTQDANLHALEVTDLTSRSRTATQRFFDGTKPEYPRRMRCIQGSDAHRLKSSADRSNKNQNLGLGERVTEMLLPERTFDAMIELFRGADFARTRPFSATRQPTDFVQEARELGPSINQSFHDSMAQRGGRMYEIVADICAFANTNGGTIYAGVSADKLKPPEGVADAQEAIEQLRSTLSRTLTPPLDVEIDTQETLGKTVVRVQVPRGPDRPYAIDDNKIYVRDETETGLAVRDEIVSLVRQGLENGSYDKPEPTQRPPSQERRAVSDTPAAQPAPQPQKEGENTAPRSGVEIVGTELKGDRRHFILRDLRNGNVVKNVTRSSARRLWHYAIMQYETNPIDEAKVTWQGNYGLWQSYHRAGENRYDLVQRDNGNLRMYFGVTESGMFGPWQAFVMPDAPEDEEAQTPPTPTPTAPLPQSEE